MRKIFATIIALAALVGCNTEAVDEVISTPAYLTTSFEVALEGDTRSFDSELNWSWESTDEIAAYQADGTNNYLNKLTLNQENNFGCEEFKYTTAEQSTFVFVYPYDAFINTEKLGYVQTGVWTPTLVGTTSGTIDNLGTVTMVHASAAFEIRVWDEGRQARKAISAATISSTENFCNATTATVSGLNSDTVVFNIAEGTFPFDITLTATDGKSYTVSKELTFELGKRTILNVEWKYPPTASYTVYSSYNSNDNSVNKDNSVDGRSIYVKNVAIQHTDNATLTLKRTYNGSALDDVALTVGQNWSATDLALGTYTFQLVLTKDDYTWSTPVSSIYVTGIPYTLNPAANDSWNAWATGGNIAWNNSGSLRMGYNLSNWGANETAYVQKTLYVPSSTSVRVYAKGMVRATAGSTVNFIIRVSGADVATASSTGGWSAKETDFNISAKVGTMTSANPTIYMQSYTSTATRHTRVDSFKLEYNN